MSTSGPGKPSTVSTGLPWQAKREPYFSLNVGWMQLIWFVIIAIIIIVIFWIFTGGKYHEFIGIVEFDRNNRPSDLIDDETLEFLQIRDPVTPINTASPRNIPPNSNRMSRPNSIVYSEQYAESQPASVVLESGTISSMDHMTPRLSRNSATDGNLEPEVNYETQIPVQSPLAPLTPFVNLNIEKKG